MSLAEEIVDALSGGCPTVGREEAVATVQEVLDKASKMEPDSTQE